MIGQEAGEVSREPLTLIAADDPITCAIYAKNKNLLEIKGRTRFKGILQRKIKCIDLQVKLN